MRITFWQRPTASHSKSLILHTLPPPLSFMSKNRLPWIIKIRIVFQLESWQQHKEDRFLLSRLCKLNKDYNFLGAKKTREGRHDRFFNGPKKPVQSYVVFREWFYLIAFLLWSLWYLTNHREIKSLGWLVYLDRFTYLLPFFYLKRACLRSL